LASVIVRTAAPQVDAEHEDIPGPGMEGSGIDAPLELIELIAVLLVPLPPPQAPNSVRQLPAAIQARYLRTRAVVRRFVCCGSTDGQIPTLRRMLRNMASTSA